MLASTDEALQPVLAEATKKIVSALGHVFTETDITDLRATLIEKLSTPNLTLPCRQCAAEVLVSVIRLKNGKFFDSTIELLTKKLDGDSTDHFQSVLLAIRETVIFFYFLKIFNLN